MNSKLIAVAVVAVVVVAAVGVYFLTQDESEDRDVSVIGRVNTDGSGIFLKEGEVAENYVTILENSAEPTDEEYYLGGGTTWVVFNKEAWAGKIFGDPGEATIQHVQLSQIANELGLGFERYQAGKPTNENTLYYIPGVNTYQMFESTLAQNSAMVGAFVWEAQYSVAMEDNCVGLVTTNDMFPGHTCCIIGASHSYITNHEDETVRFLAAYIESVTSMREAIANHVTGEKDELMNIALSNVTMPLDMEEADRIAAIESAFEIVVYTYCDETNTADSLGNLRDDMAAIAEQFYTSSLVGKNAQNLGFDSYEDYAEKLVQSQYMDKAIDYQLQDDVSTANITVAVLAGDIHQLAIHYGIAKGIFAEYGINVTLSNQSNGPAAFTAIANGNAQFAFLGAPPMTINAINGGYVTPDN